MDMPLTGHKPDDKNFLCRINVDMKIWTANEPRPSEV
jgi:hypothetical protein